MTQHIHSGKDALALTKQIEGAADLFDITIEDVWRMIGAKVTISHFAAEDIETTIADVSYLEDDTNGGLVFVLNTPELGAQVEGQTVWIRPMGKSLLAEDILTFPCALHVASKTTPVSTGSPVAQIVLQPEDEA